MLSRSDSARPIARFERPGETPQSTIAGTPFRFARASWANGSSGANEMSASGFFASITVRSIAWPRKPGTDPTTTSAPAAARATSVAEARSARTVRRRGRPESAPSASSLRSYAVTSKRPSEARSLDMSAPTRPDPRTAIFFIEPALWPGSPRPACRRSPIIGGVGSRRALLGRAARQGQDPVARDRDRVADLSGGRDGRRPRRGRVQGPPRRHSPRRGRRLARRDGRRRGGTEGRASRGST